MATETGHDFQTLQACGKRIVAALRAKRALAYDDIQLLPAIKDFGNAQAGKLTLTYFSIIFGLAVIGICIEWLLPIDLKNAIAVILLVVFVTMTIHGCWAMSGGRDCYSLEISRLLKCKSCKRNISGIMVHRMVETSQCPHCNASIENVIDCLENTG